MSAPYRQDKRIGELFTPLGDDKLVLVEFSGVEAMSELFRFEVSAICDEDEGGRVLRTEPRVALEAEGEHGIPEHRDGPETADPPPLPRLGAEDGHHQREDAHREEDDREGVALDQGDPHDEHDRSEDAGGQRRAAEFGGGVRSGHGIEA